MFGSYRVFTYQTLSSRLHSSTGWHTCRHKKRKTSRRDLCHLHERSFHTSTPLDPDGQERLVFTHTPTYTHAHTYIHTYTYVHTLMYLFIFIFIHCTGSTSAREFRNMVLRSQVAYETFFKFCLRYGAATGLPQPKPVGSILSSIKVVISDNASNETRREDLTEVMEGWLGWVRL